MNSLIIGTRASKLALWQANHVKTLLESKFKIKVTLKEISTKGDQILDRSLMDIGGKGLFLKEIEEELSAGTVDIAVHSMKDVPYELPKGLVIPCILNREDPLDAFVSNEYQDISDMPEGAVVGTSSLRRLEQLKANYPDLEFKSLRGNVDTRLRKLDDGKFDAIILAIAGMKRLGLENRISTPLDIIPAVGQGAIGVECLEKNADVLDMLKELNHEETFRCVSLERYYSEKLEGSCQTPMGCHVISSEDDCFHLKYFYVSPEKQLSYLGLRDGEWAEARGCVDEIVADFEK